jgi:hypothetical protein
MGTCNGVFSSCALPVYVIESRYVMAANAIYIRRPLMYIFLLCWAAATSGTLSSAIQRRICRGPLTCAHAIAQMADRVLLEPWAALNELGHEVPPLKHVCFRVPSHNFEFSLMGAIEGLKL